MTDSRLDAVQRFYDIHPINSRQILDAGVARRVAPDAITEAAECSQVHSFAQSRPGDDRCLIFLVGGTGIEPVAPAV